MTDAVDDALDRWHRLDPRYPRMAREHAWIQTLAWLAGAAALVALLWWLFDLVGMPRTLTAALAGVIVMLIAFREFVAPPIHYARAAWRLDADGLMIRSGAWWLNEVRVPRTRIQHTDVQQGPLQRRHGLGTLVVYTAGTHHGAVALEGVAFETATMLRDLLGRGDVSQPV